MYVCTYIKPSLAQEGCCRGVYRDTELEHNIYVYMHEHTYVCMYVCTKAFWHVVVYAGIQNCILAMLTALNNHAIIYSYKSKPSCRTEKDSLKPRPDIASCPSIGWNPHLFDCTESCTARERKSNKKVKRQKERKKERPHMHRYSKPLVLSGTLALFPLEERKERKKKKREKKTL